MSEVKEIWYMKWSVFFNKLEDQERNDLVNFLKSKLRKNDLTMKDIEIINKIQKATKGNLDK
jgi:hypothetical protein